MSESLIKNITKQSKDSKTTFLKSNQSRLNVFDTLICFRRAERFTIKYDDRYVEI